MQSNIPSTTIEEFVYPNENELKHRIQAAGLRLTAPRERIVETLAELQTHPTLADIFNHLDKREIKIAKATVYNTLEEFERIGLLKAITCVPSDTRYDTIVVDHGHFSCDMCGEIKNFSIGPLRIERGELSGYMIAERRSALRGFCPLCLRTRKC